jgi:hypothetical protein
MPAEALRAELERFLLSCSRPAILEPGQPPLELSADRYGFTDRPNGLLLEAWDDSQTWARRLVSAEPARGGRLTVFAERLGGARLKIEIADLDQPVSAQLLQRSLRENLRERFRYWLARQYPGWQITELTAGADLEHTLSPSYARALLTRGQARVAAIAAPPEAELSGSILTFGLIWLDYLRRREAPRPVQELALFLQKDTQDQTLLRLKWLDARQATFSVFVYDETGYENRVDEANTGNIGSRVEAWNSGPPTANALPQRLMDELGRVEGFEAVELGQGAVSLRIHGLAFARVEGQQVLCGIDRLKKTSDAGRVLELARRLAAYRTSAALDPNHIWYRRNPEAWLESLTRRKLRTLDAALLAAPVYGQVPSMAGTQHGILDLLAVDADGRLAVLELKASEDPNLPLQALDYWIRVEFHARRGDFPANGYFPGLALRESAPRLLLIAPALQFHPTTETILRFFAPTVEVERIGVGLEWRREFRPVSRLRGAERPGLHL